jgi:hypothetical protein
MNDRITLIRTPQGWIADYSGPHAEQIRLLFGCSLLPTAFTAKALPDVVKRTIQQLNPGVRVDLAYDDYADGAL